MNFSIFYASIVAHVHYKSSGEIEEISGDDQWTGKCRLARGTDNFWFPHGGTVEKYFNRWSFLQLVN